MRLGIGLVCILSLIAASDVLRWTDLPPGTAALLRQSGLHDASFSEWQTDRARRTASRLAEGSAEHITYYLLQTRELGGDDPLQPGMEARKYVQSLPAPERFLRGEAGGGTFSATVRERMRLFWESPVRSERHRVLRGMAERLGWQRERVVETAFRFLTLQAAGEDANALYQKRGLSADPFRPGMRAVEIGLQWLHAKERDSWKNVLLAGPGAELGSRFGVDDRASVVPPQPGALRKLIGTASLDCVDIRPEVAAALVGGPCTASTLDLAAGPLPAKRYDLAVATNILVYLDDLELGVALANLARSLRPGGCLLHNDDRFAARLFGEAAGIPVVHFAAVRLGERNGREQIDRVVVHCWPRPE